MNKYFIPGYVEVRKDKDIVAESNLTKAAILIETEDLKKEFLDLYEKGTNEIDSELEKMLYQHQLLVDKAYIDELYATVRSEMSKCLKIIMMPTENCNFGCIYCYEPNNEKRFMTIDEINTIKMFLETEIKSKKYVHLEVSWFGGEPMLCMETMKEVNRFCIELCKQEEVEFVSTITTNGYFLNEKAFNELCDLNILNYQVTIDGFDHDKKRPLMNGSGTLETIISNIKEIRKVKRNFDFLIRYNIVQGDDDDAWYKFLYTVVEDDKRFKVFVKCVGKFGGKNDDKLQIVEEVDVLNQHLENAEKAGLSVMRESKDMLSSVCVCAYPTYTFRPKGIVSRCTMKLEKKCNRIGSYGNGKVIFNQENLKKWGQIGLIDKCYRCKRILSCMAQSCPINNVMKQDMCQFLD